MLTQNKKQKTKNKKTKNKILFVKRFHSARAKLQAAYRPSPASHPSNLPSSLIKNKNHNHLADSSMKRKQIHRNLPQLLTKAACHPIRAYRNRALDQPCLPLPVPAPWLEEGRIIRNEIRLSTHFHRAFTSSTKPRPAPRVVCPPDRCACCRPPVLDYDHRHARRRYAPLLAG